LSTRTKPPPSILSLALNIKDGVIYLYRILVCDTTNLFKFYSIRLALSYGTVYCKLANQITELHGVFMQLLSFSSSTLYVVCAPITCAFFICYIPRVIHCDDERRCISRLQKYRLQLSKRLAVCWVNADNDLRR
jgi:hypothetical protein